MVGLLAADRNNGKAPICTKRQAKPRQVAACADRPLQLAPAIQHRDRQTWAACAGRWVDSHPPQQAAQGTPRRVAAGILVPPSWCLAQPDETALCHKYAALRSTAAASTAQCRPALETTRMAYTQPSFMQGGLRLHRSSPCKVIPCRTARLWQTCQWLALGSVAAYSTGAHHPASSSGAACCPMTLSWTISYGPGLPILTCVARCRTAEASCCWLCTSCGC